jgi:hypothetical protein
MKSVFELPREVGIWEFLSNVYSECVFKLFFLLALQPNSGLGRLHEPFRFTSVTRSRTVGGTPWTDDQLVAIPLPIHKHRKRGTQHKQTSMS